MTTRITEIRRGPRTSGSPPSLASRLLQSHCNASPFSIDRLARRFPCNRGSGSIHRNQLQRVGLLSRYRRNSARRHPVQARQLHDRRGVRLRSSRCQSGASGRPNRKRGLGDPDPSTRRPAFARSGVPTRLRGLVSCWRYLGPHESSVASAVESVDRSGGAAAIPVPGPCGSFATITSSGTRPPPLALSPGNTANDDRHP